MIKCPRCDRSRDVLDAPEMFDTGLGDKFCIDCGIYFYADTPKKSVKLKNSNQQKTE